MGMPLHLDTFCPLQLRPNNLGQASIILVLEPQAQLKELALERDASNAHALERDASSAHALERDANNAHALERDANNAHALERDANDALAWDPGGHSLT